MFRWLRLFQRMIRTFGTGLRDTKGENGGLELDVMSENVGKSQEEVKKNNASGKMTVFGRFSVRG